MYGWIDLIDVIREDQVEALSNIGQMLKSQDIESQILAISLLLAPEFSNIWKAALDCGSIKIHYNSGTKSWTLKELRELVVNDTPLEGTKVNIIDDVLSMYKWKQEHKKGE